VRTGEIPQIFAQFRDAVGERHWEQRIKGVKADIRGNRLLRDYLLEENEIAFGCSKCGDLLSRRRPITLREIENPEVYEALTLATQVVSMINVSSEDQAHRLVRRIHWAFKNPDEMRAIQLELMVATHFVSRGHTVRWPEMEGLGTFDLLIDGIGIDGLEIECKSISNDKGRKIHHREALEFHQLLAPQLKPIGDNLSSGLSVVLTVPKRLPRSVAERHDLARRVVSSILSGKDACFEDKVEIRIMDFDTTLLGDLKREGTPIVSNERIDAITATRNRHAMVVGRKSSGAIVLVLQSSDDDTYLEHIFDTISESAKRQLTKKRPAMFVAGLKGVRQDHLVDVAQQDRNPQQARTALQVAVTEFLSSQVRDHVIGVAFLSEASLGTKAQSHVASGGSAYVFPKRDSPFWHEDFIGLFSETGRDRLDTPS
jgi:hypothetical protein